jgi:hypothetical protein
MMQMPNERQKKPKNAFSELYFLCNLLSNNKMKVGQTVNNFFNKNAICWFFAGCLFCCFHLSVQTA